MSPKNPPVIKPTAFGSPSEAQTTHPMTNLRLAQDLLNPARASVGRMDRFSSPGVAAQRHAADTTRSGSACDVLGVRHALHLAEEPGAYMYSLRAW